MGNGQRCLGRTMRRVTSGVGGERFDCGIFRGAAGGVDGRSISAGSGFEEF